MSYQPPLWGYRDLLNFRAGSFPDQGGWCIIIAGCMAFLAVVLELFRKSKTEKGTHPQNSRFGCFCKSFWPHHCPGRCRHARACAPGFVQLGPQPIAYGKDGCEHCKMTIIDPRFGAELLSKQGKAYKFDSGECMIGYIKEGRIEQDKIAQLLVTDFADPQQLIDAKTAHFLHSEAIPSPMGANVSAFASEDAVSRMIAEKGGRFINWNDFYQSAGGGVALEQ